VVLLVVLVLVVVLVLDRIGGARLPNVTRHRHYPRLAVGPSNTFSRMAEAVVALERQAGVLVFQMEPLVICTTFLTNKLQTKFEDEDDDEYENETCLAALTVPPTPLVARTKKPILRVLAVLGLAVSESRTIRPGLRPARRSGRRAPYFGLRR
jgi:hypothetical protein